MSEERINNTDYSEEVKEKIRQFPYLFDQEEILLGKGQRQIEDRLKGMQTTWDSENKTWKWGKEVEDIEAMVICTLRKNGSINIAAKSSNVGYNDITKLINAAWDKYSQARHVALAALDLIEAKKDIEVKRPFLNEWSMEGYPPNRAEKLLNAFDKFLLKEYPEHKEIREKINE